MSSEPRVWVAKRNCKGKTTYHLRWICPLERRWKSRRVGTDSKRAQREAAKLEGELSEGTYRNIRRTTWDAFVGEHVRRLSGKRNATEAMRTLTEFGKVSGNPDPARITYQMVESYVEEIATATKTDKGNSPATVNKKLRYIRAALNAAVRRGYIARTPIEKWQWMGEDKKQMRIASTADETALLDAADTLYGSKLRAFVAFALGTGGRRGELLGLRWCDVDLDGGWTTFTRTKGKQDRRVPIDSELVRMLRRLQAQTLQAGGPFIGMGDNLGRWWIRVVKKAEVKHITIHDLRRSYVTRLIRAGAPLPTVQRLAGHANIKTTLEHYNETTDDDLRAAVAKLHATSAG